MADKKTALKKLAGAKKSTAASLGAQTVGAASRHLDLYKERASKAGQARAQGKHGAAAEHHAAAAFHAERAGLVDQAAHHEAKLKESQAKLSGGSGEWDESKHSRDESGKFG